MSRARTQIDPAGSEVGAAGVRRSRESRSRRWRRWLRFSVRALLIAVLVIGCAMGWLARTARIQREAVAAIQKGGGVPRYNWEFANGSPVPNPKPWYPDWLGKTLGTDYLYHVTGVYLPMGTEVELAWVGELGRLESALIGGRGLTEAGAAHLAGLACLRRLHLPSSRLGDRGYAFLESLTQLEGLNLGRANITDGSLAHFARLKRLRTLDLSHTRIRGPGMTHLKGLKSLVNLQLEGSLLDDSGLEGIGAMTQLQHLDLAATQITDAGLEHLTGLRNLVALRLASTRISGSGLVHLKSLTSLKSLGLGSTSIKKKDTELTQLKAALPGLKITQW
jgi:Leucine rich repeat/Leucine Rich repeat